MNRVPHRQSLIFLLLFVVSPVALATEDKEELARQAALEWLNLIDQNQYRDSWKQASRLFQQRVGAIIWQQKLVVGRKLLGKTITRKPISATYTTKMPDAPEGEYVIIRFQTEFSNRASTVETVTPMLDGQHWRVAGYYIR